MPCLAGVFCAYIFAMALVIDCAAAEESIVVYPQVLESREDTSEKILLIGDYTLNLTKASVLADTVLLLDVTDYGTVERRVQGAHYERHLYEDAKKQASLVLKPVGRADYHVTGMVNATHRITPFTSWERSSQQKVPHRVSEIDAVSGSYEIIERSAKTHGAFSRAFVENDVDEDPVPEEIENDPSPKYTIELYFITGRNHSSFFGNEIEDGVSYAIIFMNAVSLRLQQLDPPVRIGLTVIEALQTTPPYVTLHQDGNMIVYSTIDGLSKHVKEDRLKSKSDIVYMASSLRLAKYDKDNKYHKSILGLAGGLGKACGEENIAIGADVPDTFSGVQTAAHEIAHLLGAPHDGDDDAKDCGPKSPYLMSPYRRGKTICAFSDCSKAIIAKSLNINGKEYNILDGTGC